MSYRVEHLDGRGHRAPIGYSSPRPRVPRSGESLGRVRRASRRLDVPARALPFTFTELPFSGLPFSGSRSRR